MTELNRIEHCNDIRRMKKLLCVSMGFAHTCLLSKKYKLRVISVKMAERGPLGNYHVSETLKILEKKTHKKTCRINFIRTL